MKSFSCRSCSIAVGPLPLAPPAALYRNLSHFRIRPIRLALPDCGANHVMKARLSVLCLVLSALLIPGVAAGAEEGTAGFRSPSKNIACQYIAEGKSGTLRCDIVE